MSVDRREPTYLGVALYTRESPTSEMFTRQLNSFRRVINGPLNPEMVRSKSPLIVWEGLDMDDTPRSVGLVPISVDQEFKITEALVRFNLQNVSQIDMFSLRDLHLSVARPDFASDGYYIGERTMLVSWFKSVCIAIQDCISARAIQACLKSVAKGKHRDDYGRKIKPDRIGSPIHREFCRQLSITRYGGY